MPKPAKASVELHRELGWLEAIVGTREYNAYWASRLLRHRWRRFEVTRRSLVVGPFTAIFPRPERPPPSRPHLYAIDGGKED